MISSELPAAHEMRSPLLMNRDDTALLVIDVQEKLWPHIEDHDLLAWNIARLLEGAGTLGVPILLTEQYPKGLGATIEPLRTQEDDSMVFEKLMFSCRECEQLYVKLKELNVTKVLLAGIETHVCVMQSALDLLAAGFDVYVCLDAVGSRSEADFMTAVARMETSGVTLVSTEMALFEWCERAGSDEFKAISKLVQQAPPSEE